MVKKLENPSQSVVTAAAALADAVDKLPFAEPVHTVYNPLRYAWEAHRSYCERFAQPSCEVLLLGMNPGPFGMAQTGVPFGEINAVKDWMGINCEVGQPPVVHPKRPIDGFACTRSEVSGRRLWGYFASRFGSPDAFFAKHFVVNYCPLVFMTDSGRNITPDQLPAQESAPLFAACDAHLLAVAKALQPRWVVGVGGFAEARARSALSGLDCVSFGKILHPSPASPAANRDWAGTAEKQLLQQGIW
jgi:single-strand selective monofunctional uracil DNA glycosylase